MPTAAFALKKNLCGAVASKTRDNEYSTASLGNSEEASVKSSPRNTIPEFVHFTEEGEEVSPVVGSEDTWHVFQHDPPRSESFHKVEEREREDRPFAVREPFALPCDAEVLAGESCAPDVCSLPIITAWGPALIVSGSDTSLNCVGWLLNQLGKLTICKGDDVSELWDSGESAGKD
jgi:hypothetical protein